MEIFVCEEGGYEITVETIGLNEIAQVRELVDQATAAAEAAQAAVETTLSRITELETYRSLLRVSVFTESGTWNKGAGTNKVLAIVIGGGGGGGGSCTSPAGSAGGGGGGGASLKLIDVAAITSVTVTVGAGGAGGTGGTDPTHGGTGGTSSFGTHCSATGGAGGLRSDHGGSGGAGGEGSGGDLNMRGGAGVSGHVTLDGYYASGGAAPIFSGGGSVGGFIGYGGGGAANNATSPNGNDGLAGGDGLVVVLEFS